MNRFLQILLPQCDASTRVWLSSVGTSSVLHVLAGAALATWLGSVAPQLFPPRQGFNSIQLTASQVIEVEPTEATEYDDSRVEISASSDTADLVAASPMLIQYSASPADVIPAVESGDLATPVTTVEQLQLDRTAVSESPELADTPRHEMPRSRQITKPPSVNSSAASVASQEDAGQLDAIPTKIFSPQPDYPANALQQGLEGRVVLRVAINASGQVTRAVVLRSSGYSDLDQAAQRAVKRWRFDSPRKLGVAVQTEIAIPIRFHIER